MRAKPDRTSRTGQEQEQEQEQSRTRQEQSRTRQEPQEDKAGKAGQDKSRTGQEQEQEQEQAKPDRTGQEDKAGKAGQDRTRQDRIELFKKKIEIGLGAVCIIKLRRSIVCSEKAISQARKKKGQKNDLPRQKHQPSSEK
jgi:hypothetical protein